MRPADLQTLLLGQIPPALFKPVLVDRVQAGKIHFENQVVRADGHSATRSAEVQRAWERLYAILEAHGLDLPLRSEIQSETGLDPKRLEQLVRPAVRAGDLFEIGEKRLALPATLADLAGRVREFTHSSGGISVIEAKQLFGLGRNVTIEVLEFFDEIGYTRRHDNLRVIANPDAARQRLGE